LKNIAKVEYNYDIQNYDSATITYQENMVGKEHASADDKEKPGPILFRDAGDQITMTIAKLKGTNAVNIAQRAIEEIQKNKEKLLNHGVGFIVTRNYGIRANEAVNELVHHLEITVPFLGWRESLVVTIAVPMILATTLFIALMTDQTINRITLFAFLLSLGLIVDDAIIVIENIHRRLHLKESEELEFDEIIIQATDEIGPSTNIATIAIMLTMIPMGFVGGMMGQFMKPIPLNVPVALGISLFVAYVFAPYFARKFIKFESHPKCAEEEN
jgi:multidrug efflux pump subunit AcrB